MRQKFLGPTARSAPPGKADRSRIESAKAERIDIAQLEMEFTEKLRPALGMGPALGSGKADGVGREFVGCAATRTTAKPKNQQSRWPDPRRDQAPRPACQSPPTSS